MAEPKTIRKNLPVDEPQARQGCAMFVVGGAVIVMLITWAVFTFLKQRQEIIKFTHSAPAALPVVNPDPAAQQSALEKLASLKASPKPARVAFSLAELQALLATQEAAQGLRSHVSPTRMQETLEVQISVLLGNLGRYLIGNVSVLPEIDKEVGLKLKTTRLEVPGHTPPADFLQGYHDNAFFDLLVMAPLRDKPEIREVLKTVKAAKIEKGQFILQF